MVRRVKRSPYASDIMVCGEVTPAQKTVLMRQSHIVAMTSIKEGWGLVVTEANSQGTPAIVYDTDGLRDSVRHNVTGIICHKNKPYVLAKNIVALLHHRKKYDQLRKSAWMWSKEINFDKCYRGFMCVILFK